MVRIRFPPAESRTNSQSLDASRLHDFSSREIQRGYAELTQNRPDALLLNAESGPDDAGLIVHLAEVNKLPAMYPYPIYIENGGLMAYTADVAELGHQLADEVRRILQGARAGGVSIRSRPGFGQTSATPDYSV